ncbi:type I-C CRISPR-associated protein Cas8c/Csd1 [Chitinimonas koreensis]|uniref:type I-C CRISPR-associated protein Cas8c/Csd1 n=1 Tax=Chitinimonas koreensis TaxID=356302 RepID=UPI00040B6D70|nr:type I-C CRISPR-associated protein Cas8c/Csd1 [Chitinimonas koreensis]
MILQALDNYYRRRAAHPEPARRLPAVGLVEQPIGYLIEIDPAGRLVQLQKTGEMRGKKHEPSRFLVPRGVKKTSGVAANLLWDSAEYVLGVDTRGKPERVAEQHAAFRAKLAALPEAVASDTGIRAVQAFFDRLDLAALAQLPQWADIADTNPTMTFRLLGDDALVCQRPALQAAPEPTDDDATLEAAICLVRGQPDTVARLHPAIKGVWGAQTSGANIVSFNLDAFNSYGKTQGNNAPIGETAAQTYTTALNALLARDSTNRVQVGDASTVFWADVDDEPMEAGLAFLLGEPAKDDDPDRGIAAVQAIFKAIESGRYQHEAGSRRFHVLALAPNAARIAIRDYHDLPLAELAPRIKRHFDDLAIQGGPNDPPHPSLFRLLAALAAQGKADNIPPRLGGEVLRSVLDGRPYPAQLINLAVLRCRAERKVTYARAAMIKAWLNRDVRAKHTEEKEFQVMLDTSNNHPGYRLGRLFAALEKIQEEAQPGINATIRERFYGAASSTPATVFATLLRLSNHHLAKLKPGRKVNLERLLGEISGGLADFPAHLSLPDQGRFALGYYHQRQDFFTKRSADTDNTAPEEQ